MVENFFRISARGIVRNRKVRGYNGVEKDYQYVISTIPTPNILSFADKLSTSKIKIVIN